MQQTDRREKEAIESLARQFRIEVYQTFRQQRGVFTRRRAAWNRVLATWAAAGSRFEQQDRLLDWLESAIRSSQPSGVGPLPADPQFEMRPGVSSALVLDEPLAPPPATPFDLPPLPASSRGGPDPTAQTPGELAQPVIQGNDLPLPTATTPGPTAARIASAPEASDPAADPRALGKSSRDSLGRSRSLSGVRSESMPDDRVGGVMPSAAVPPSDAAAQSVAALLARPSLPPALGELPAPAQQPSGLALPKDRVVSSTSPAADLPGEHAMGPLASASGSVAAKRPSAVGVGQRVAPWPHAEQLLTEMDDPFRRASPAPALPASPEADFAQRVAIAPRPSQSLPTGSPLPTSPPDDSLPDDSAPVGVKAKRAVGTSSVQVNLIELAARIAGNNLAIRALEADIDRPGRIGAAGVGLLVDRLSGLAVQQKDLMLVRQVVPASDQIRVGRLESPETLVSRLEAKISEARRTAISPGFPGTETERQAELAQLDELSRQLAQIASQFTAGRVGQDLR